MPDSGPFQHTGEKRNPTGQAASGPVQGSFSPTPKHRFDADALVRGYDIGHFVKDLAQGVTPLKVLMMQRYIETLNVYQAAELFRAVGAHGIKDDRILDPLINVLIARQEELGPHDIALVALGAGRIGYRKPRLVDMLKSRVVETFDEFADDKGREILPTVVAMCRLVAPHEREQIWGLTCHLEGRQLKLFEETALDSVRRFYDLPPFGELRGVERAESVDHGFEVVSTSRPTSEEHWRVIRRLFDPVHNLADKMEKAKGGFF